MKTRRELFTGLSTMTLAPLALKLLGASTKRAPLAPGDDLRISFENTTLPKPIQNSTLVFTYDVPGHGRHQATVDFVPSNMHGTHWDGTVVAVKPVVAKLLIFPDRPVMPTRVASFSGELDVDAIFAKRLSKKLFSRHVI